MTGELEPQKLFLLKKSQWLIYLTAKINIIEL
jgi:hypothetical protein